MSNHGLIVAGAIVIAVLFFYFLAKFARAHPLSRKEDRIIKEIVDED